MKNGSKENANTYTSRLDKFLLSYARTIDDIDMYLSPIRTLTLWHSNSHLKNFGIASTVFELGILKTPFVIFYTARTRDYKSAFEWLGWEALVHAIPYEGGLLNIRRNYEKNTIEYYSSKMKYSNKNNNKKEK